MNLVSSLSVLLFGLANGQDMDMPNYFIGDYNGITFYAYPINICIKTGVTDFNWRKFVCVEDGDGWMVQRNTYSKGKGNCKSENLQYTTNFTWQANNTLGPYDFNCGSYDNWAEIDVCTGDAKCGDKCSLGGTTYAVQDICQYGGNGTSNTYRRTTCNDTHAIINWYYDADTCESNGEPNSTATWTTQTEECLYFSTVDAGALGVFTVYAELTGCVYDGTWTTTPSPTKAPTSESGAVSIYSTSLVALLAMTLVAALFNY